MNIPNLLTVLRIILIPVFLYLLLEERYREALLLFAIGGATDALDGFLARRMGQVTEMGKILDPIADKLFLLTSFTASYLINILPLWLLALAIIKEVVILSGCAILYLIFKRLEIRPALAGKATTTMQIVAMLFILLNGTGIGGPTLLMSVFVVTAVFIVYSTLSYVITGFKIYLEETV